MKDKMTISEFANMVINDPSGVLIEDGDIVWLNPYTKEYGVIKAKDKSAT